MNQSGKAFSADKLMSLFLRCSLIELQREKRALNFFPETPEFGEIFLNKIGVKSLDILGLASNNENVCR